MAALLSFYPPKPNSIKATATQSPPSTSQLLDQKYGRKGIKFTDSGDILAVEMTVRNGSSLRLQLSDALVTSYKPKVHWKDDGFEETVYTLSGGSDSGNGSVSPARGGIGLVLNDLSKLGSDGLPWSPSNWVLKDVDSDSIDALQVELNSTNEDGTLQITYIVSLFTLSMATAVVVKNTGTQNVKLTSAILSHLKFKSRNGSAILGLKGCSYCAHPPLSSHFEILSPAEVMESEPPGWSSYLGSIFSSKESGKDSESKDDPWTVEDNKFTMLRSRLSRVYAAPPTERLKRIYNTPPSRYETIDQGKGIGFRIIRMGYDDIYVGSPGTSSQKYGKDHFICTGPASMLVPVVLKPGDGWRGAQVIEHDNL